MHSVASTVWLRAASVQVKEAVVGKGPGRICIYMVVVVLILAVSPLPICIISLFVSGVICGPAQVAYGIYTIVNGQDPCKEYNNEACTEIGNRRLGDPIDSSLGVI